MCRTQTSLKCVGRKTSLKCVGTQCLAKMCRPYLSENVLGRNPSLKYVGTQCLSDDAPSHNHPRFRHCLLVVAFDSFYRHAVTILNIIHNISNVANMGALLSLPLMALPSAATLWSVAASCCGAATCSAVCSACGKFQSRSVDIAM
jgi:hypothetical protein